MSLKYFRGKIDPEWFGNKMKISDGGNSEVYSVEDEHTHQKYIAKQINNNNNENMIDREIRILSSLNHPTIIQYYGYSIAYQNDQRIYTLYLEYGQKGSLSNLINSAMTCTAPIEYDNTKRQIILIGIARAMQFLHDRNIIHRDLKPVNVVLDSNYYPKLIDFGLSRDFQDENSYDQYDYGIGTIPYMAPEVLNGRMFNGKADVYSFGILMYQVLTDKQPYQELVNNRIDFDEFQNRVVNNNYRPIFPDIYINEPLKNLIEKCWSAEPDDRPTFREIFDKLSNDKEYRAYGVNDQEVGVYIENITVYDRIDDLLGIIDKYKFVNEQIKNEKLILLKSIISILPNFINEFKNSIIDQIQKDKEAFKNSIIAHINNNKNELESIILDLKKDKSQLRDENNNMRKQIDELNKNKSALESSNKDLSIENNKLKKELQTCKALMHKKIVKLKKDLSISMENNIEILEKENALFIKTLNESKNKMENGLLDAKKENIKLKEQVNQLKKQILTNKLTYTDENDNMRKQIVELNKNKSALESSNKDLSFENNKLKEELKTSKTLMQSKIVKLKKDLTVSMENNIEIIEKENRHFIEQLKELKDKIKSYETYLNCHYFVGEKFSSFSLSSQKQIIETMISISCIPSYKQFLTKLNKLLSYFLAFAKYDNIQFIEIENYSIKVLPDVIQMFYQTNKLTELLNYLLEFDDCTVQIKYPSDSFYQIYNEISKTKKNKSNLKIEVIITEISINDKFIKEKNIESVIIDKSVTKINESYFKGNSNLKKITIPSTIKSIGEYAFSGCSKLTHIEIPNRITKIEEGVFQYCRSLNNIIIPQSVTEIEENAFEGCQSLEQMTIPLQVKEIKPYTFSGCNKLKSIFMSTFVRSIDDYAFNGCTSLIDITIPSKCKTIGNCAFRKCKSLKKVIIPALVKEIGSCAFSGCTSLQYALLPPSLKVIKKSLFYGCESLIKILFPKNVRIIESHAFSKCKKMKSIVIPFSVLELGDGVFNECTSLKSVIIPSFVKKIGNGAFQNCKSLTRISLPNSLTEINEYTFDGCSSLNEVDIPSSIKTIKNNAFRGCNSFKNREIIESNSNLENNWFYYLFFTIFISFFVTSLLDFGNLYDRLLCFCQDGISRNVNLMIFGIKKTFNCHFH